MTDTKKKKLTDAEKLREEAAKNEAARAEADAKYREAVAKAGEERQKTLDKLPDSAGNIAEVAWNDTKEEADPLYASCAALHRQKLDAALVAIEATGTAGIQGLEDYEARVLELLAERKIPIGGTALVPTDSDGVEKEPTKSAKTGK